MKAADDPRIPDADAVLARAFVGKWRDHGPPAVVHPRRVAARLAESWGKALGPLDASLVVAALLHDLVEDTDVGLGEVGARFGDDVRTLVDWVTKRDGETKPAYLGRLGAAPEAARRLKVCDRIDNLRDVVCTPGTDRARRYLAETVAHVVPLAVDLPGLREQLAAVVEDVRRYVEGAPREAEPVAPGSRTQAAIARADGLFRGDPARPAPPKSPATRTYAIGDPQAPAPRFFAILDHQGLLGDDGWLRPDVALVSLGDHFDFPNATIEVQRREGCRILGWLAAHAAAQAPILLGNHDLARVTELCEVDEQTFACANALGRLVYALEHAVGAGAVTEALTRRFHLSFPAIATPELAARDYASHGTVQRELVVGLLLEGRARLGLAASSHGSPLLCVHAGLTTHQLGLLGAPAEPAALAAALEAHLAAALGRVRHAWEDGARPPLELAPLHVAGRAGAEGGGAFYHRPAFPSSGPTWDPVRPRRFDPRTLPIGLRQGVGHTGHSTAIKRLRAWADEHSDEALGAVRTLRVRGDEVSYTVGSDPIGADEAGLWMIDGTMARCSPELYELFPLDPL